MPGDGRAPTTVSLAPLPTAGLFRPKMNPATCSAGDVLKCNEVLHWHWLKEPVKAKT